MGTLCRDWNFTHASNPREEKYSIAINENGGRKRGKRKEGRKSGMGQLLPFEIEICMAPLLRNSLPSVGDLPSLHSNLELQELLEM